MQNDDKALAYNLGRCLRVLLDVSLPELESLLTAGSELNEDLLKAKFRHAQVNRGHQGSCFKRDLDLGGMYLNDKREALDKALKLLIEAKEALRG